MKDKIIYYARGLVIGSCWGGGKVGYSARNLQNRSKKELIKEINNRIEDGSLDSGMGFEEVLGALLMITKRTSKIIKGKEYVNKEYEESFFGNLNDREKEFLKESINYF